jgi:hypothetical protein
VLDRVEWSSIFKAPAEIPTELLSVVRACVHASLGKSVSEMFPAFARSFPQTTTSMERHWPTPLLACSKPYGSWLCWLVLERADLNLCFDLTLDSTPAEGPEFEEDHKMLPREWYELYRYFSSFSIGSGGPALFWRNSPFSYSSRDRLEDHRERIGASRKEAKAFAERIGSDPDALRCWMWSDNGDALFIDEQKCDRRVYHIGNDDFSDSQELMRPGLVLDPYLSFIVEGGSASGFDLRRGARRVL